jgi:hypothetical protein
MKSAQGVYPIILDDDTAFAFVEFIHNRGSAILQAAGDQGTLCLCVSYGGGTQPHRQIGINN